MAEVSKSSLSTETRDMIQSPRILIKAVLAILPPNSLTLAFQAERRSPVAVYVVNVVLLVRACTRCRLIAGACVVLLAHVTQFGKHEGRAGSLSLTNNGQHHPIHPPRRLRRRRQTVDDNLE